MKVRKVAVVAYSAPPFSAGGVASAHYNLFRSLQQTGIDTCLFTFGDHGHADSSDLIRRGTPEWLVALIRKASTMFLGLLQPGKTAYQTADILKSQIGARRMNRAIEKFSPEVIVLSDHGAPGLMLKKAKGAKIILVSHHNPARFLALADGNYSKLDAHWAVALEQQTLTKVDAVVCPSTYMKQWFEKTYKFSGPVRVIPNVLDENYLNQIPPLDLRSQFNLELNACVVYLPSAGSLLKGAGYILDLVQQLTAHSQQPIGFYVPGEVSTAIVDKAAGLSNQARLCFTGPLSYEEHIGNVKACSFGISPSLMENYSMALLEAVHCGVPMLAFATGGNAEIISDNENGFLVPEGDGATLGKLASELLAPVKLQALRLKTAAYSQQHLSGHIALQRYLDLMDDL